MTPSAALAAWDASMRRPNIPARTSATNEAIDNALLAAAKTGDVSTVRRLLANQAAVEATDRYGNTPLVWACINGHEDVARVLLAYGANPAAHSGAGKTAFQIVWHTQPTSFSRLLQSASTLRRHHLSALITIPIALLRWRRRAVEACYRPGGPGYMAALQQFEASMSLLAH